QEALLRRGGWSRRRQRVVRHACGEVKEEKLERLLLLAQRRTRAGLGYRPGRVSPRMKVAEDRLAAVRRRALASVHGSRGYAPNRREEGQVLDVVGHRRVIDPPLRGRPDSGYA